MFQKKPQGMTKPGVFMKHCPTNKIKNNLNAKN